MPKKREICSNVAVLMPECAISVALLDCDTHDGCLESADSWQLIDSQSVGILYIINSVVFISGLVKGVFHDN